MFRVRFPIRKSTLAHLLAAGALVVGCGGSGPPAARDGSVDGSGHDAVGGDGGDGGATDGAGDRPVAAVYDLGADFSLTQDPNGVWQYGYTQGATLSAAAFQLDTYAVTVAPMGFWHPDGQTGYYPYVAENEGTTTMTDSSGSWALRPGEVAMEGSPSGQYSMVQFTAPGAGQYTVSAQFSGIHAHLSSTDVHVLDGERSLFDADIDGYGGDPSFHAIEGQNPTATFQGTRALATGEVLSFAVGVGANGTNSNDTTGLLAHIELLR